MSLRLKMMYNMLVGAWGGLIAWAILDAVLRLKPSDVWIDAMVNGAIVGTCIGALVSSFGGLISRRVTLVLRGLFVGLVTGIVGGMIGLMVGEAAFQTGRLLSSNTAAQQAYRAFGWATFGIGIGIAEGVLTLSLKRLLYGGIGGVIGGFVGGMAFIAIAQTSSLQYTNRAVGFTLLGAFIGLLVGLIPDLLKEAWIKVVSSGRNEGKEFLLDKRVNSIGSSDGNDIGLFGDRTILPRHAEIRQDGGQFILRALNGQTIFVNNAPVTTAVLQDGAQLRMGQVKLIFRRRRRG